jgi:hypothetical protein
MRYNDGQEGKLMAPETMTKMLRRALQADKRPLLQISTAAGLPYPVVYRFAKGQREGLSLASAEKLAVALGLELRPRKGR